VRKESSSALKIRESDSGPDTQNNRNLESGAGFRSKESDGGDLLKRDIKHEGVANLNAECPGSGRAIRNEAESLRRANTRNKGEELAWALYRRNFMRSSISRGEVIKRRPQ